MWGAGEVGGKSFKRHQQVPNANVSSNFVVSWWWNRTKQKKPWLTHFKNELQRRKPVYRSRFPPAGRVNARGSRCMRVLLFWFWPRVVNGHDRHISSHGRLSFQWSVLLLSSFGFLRGVSAPFKGTRGGFSGGFVEWPLYIPHAFM